MKRKSAPPPKMDSLFKWIGVRGEVTNPVADINIFFENLVSNKIFEKNLDKDYRI